MFMDRPDISGARLAFNANVSTGNPRIQFVYAEAQAPISPIVRGAVDGIEIQRTYYIPNAPSFFANPNQAIDKIMRAFLGRAVRFAVGLGNEFTLSRMIPMADPANARCWAASIPELSILGTNESKAFLNTLVPEECGGPNVFAAVPVHDGGSVWKCVVIYRGVDWDVVSDNQLITNVASARAPWAGPGAAPPNPFQGANLAADEGAAVACRVPRFCSVYGDTVGRYKTLPGGLMWVVPGEPFLGIPEGAQVLPEGLGVARPDKITEIVWRNVPENCIPEQAHQECQDCVNQHTFGPYLPETLLLEHIKRRPRLSPLGERIYDVHYTFRARLQRDNPNDTRSVGGVKTIRGWNYEEVVRGGFLCLRRINSKSDGGGSNPYRVVDFQRLFRPPRAGEF